MITEAIIKKLGLIEVFNKDFDFIRVFEWPELSKEGYYNTRLICYDGAPRWETETIYQDTYRIRIKVSADIITNADIDSLQYIREQLNEQIVILLNKVKPTNT